MISAALSWTRARSSGVIRSSTGVMTGWSATMRGSPSTIVVSLPNARMLSLLCAFATLRSNRRSCLASAKLCIRRAMSSRSSRANQMSMLRIPAKSCMASRYARTTARLMTLRCLASNPRSRPATAKLATSRLTSHSNGPGNVSSKSLTLKTSRRSGAAKTPKFERCASPQSCTCRSVCGVAARSPAMSAAPPR